MLLLFAQAVWESVYMTIIATFFSYVIGLPAGILCAISAPTGIKPNKGLSGVLGAVLNVLRSVPFVILMVALIPFTRLIVGTSIGSVATIVPLVVASFPVVARSVENSVNGVSSGVVEAAQSMGASNWQIITRVLLVESRPSLITGLASSAITVLGYSAMAGVAGGGGLGAIALNYGYYRGQSEIMYVMIVLLVILVQLLQEAGAKTSVLDDKRIQIKKRK